MAFTGIGKLIKDLVTGTPADTDYFAFGNTDLKKVSFPNLKKALGIDALNSALEGKQDALSGGSKTNGENIDGIFINTVVWISTKSSGTLPNSDYNLLLCLNNGINTVQITFPFSGNNPVKWRMHVNGGWQAWRSI